MKKLLTMVVSCASALFAMADVQLPTGTDFESYKVNDAGAVAGGPAIPLNINKDDNGGDGDRYWYSKTSTEGIVEAAVTNNGTTAYLMLDTSEVLERTIGGYSTVDGTTTFASTNLVGGAIYFDSKVQFTATEDDVTPSEGDKLVVWLKAVEGTDAVGNEGEEDYVAPVAGSTNLVITAGNGIVDDKAVPGNFVVSSELFPIEPNSWYRLTIKAFVNNLGTFFNVYINGVLVTVVVNGEEKTDFASLVSAAEEDLNPTTISAVGFKGNGAVDDLVFTKSNPLGFSVTATIPAVDGADASAKYSVDGSTWVDVISGSPFTVPASTANITFKVSIADGFVLENGTKIGESDDGSGNFDWTITVPVSSSANNAITLTVKAAPESETGAFSIDGVGSFATLADAIEAATANATIKLTADATVAEWLKVEKNVVLDLNGCTLTEKVDPEDSDYGAIYVKMGCQLTITDSSKDKNGKIASNGDIVIGNYGKVIVEAGTIESGDVRDNDVSIYNMNYAGTHVGTATINGGAVESVWNCGTITVAEDASVTYLDNSGAAEIAAGATVGDVVLMNGDDAQGVAGAGTITAPQGLSVVSGVEGYTATYNEGVWSLVEDSNDPELPKPSTDGDAGITVEYETEAEAAIRDAFTTGGTFTPPTAPLVVEVNGEVLLGNAAVEMINEVTKVFDITGGKFFDATGKMEVTFKATSADPAKITYEAKVGAANATVDAAYKVVPKYIDLATGNEITPAQDATAKFFKLVIKPVTE